MDLFDVYPLFDIVPVKAKGVYLWDEKGNQYLDLYGGHAVISIGHSHPHYIETISNQLNKIGFYSNSVKIPQQQQLADLLAKLSGYPDYHLFLCNSGAEANENALKLASFQTGRKRIIAFKGSFHGRTSLAVASTDDTSIQAPVNATENILFIPFNDEDALEKHFGEDICAVIVEGIQGVGGIQVVSDAFLKKARMLCDKYGAKLILDEIQSGFGRTGKFFAHQYSDVKADLITMAKGMGNGFPIGGVLIHPSFQAKHGLLGTTFGGSYLACAAAIAVAEIILKEELLKNALETGDYLLTKLSGLPGVKEVRGKGLMIGVELNFPCASLRKTLLDKHRIFTGSSSSKNTLRILPPLNITRKEIDPFLTAFAEELHIKHQTA
jgi:acetylornithine/N-succinyldiaminopimelate aminotransferase